MPDEVYADCPACGEEIPFYETVDVLEECPKCGTDKETLFDTAMGISVGPDEGTSSAAVATDGGQPEESDD